MALVLPVGHFDAGLGAGSRAAPVTALFALLCAFVFIGPQDQGRDGTWAQSLGAVPSDVVASLGGRAAGDEPSHDVWPPLTLATSLVVHASWAHLFYNVVALWVFGTAIERVAGSGPALLLYLGGGVLASLGEVAFSAGSAVPIVGASGAVAVAAGAFAVGFPRSRVVVAVLFLTVPIPAWVALGAWAALEVVVGMGRGGGDVAHVAHLCGFVLGGLAAWTVPFRQKRSLDADSGS